MPQRKSMVREKKGAKKIAKALKRTRQKKRANGRSPRTALLGWSRHFGIAIASWLVGQKADIEASDVS
jgi:hypothetical protein